MAVLVDWPSLAALPALLLAGLSVATRRRAVLAVALGWLLYVPYELGMKYRLLCSGECNIRVDLLLLYPALTLASLWALGVAAREMARRRAGSC
jgi:hypothetical protein